MNDSTRKKGKKESKLKGYDNVFATRLRDLMEQTKTTQGTLAKESGCSRQAISQYMDGSSMPNVDKLLCIADHFGVSTDYLLGREEKKNKKELQHIVSEYTGLSEEAIKELRECINTEYYTDLVPDYQNLWIMETIPDFKEVLNQIIESGCMRKVVGLISDYYRSMEMATDVCNDLLKPLEEINSHNRISGTDKMEIIEPLELLEILTEQKEIRLHYYEIQECLKSFVKLYREKTIKAYSDKTKEFNIVYNEYERLTRHYYDERLTRQEGEAHGNNQETQ